MYKKHGLFPMLVSTVLTLSGCGGNGQSNNFTTVQTSEMQDNTAAANNPTVPENELIVNGFIPETLTRYGSTGAVINTYRFEANTSNNTITLINHTGADDIVEAIFFYEARGYLTRLDLYQNEFLVGSQLYDREANGRLNSTFITSYQGEGTMYSFEYDQQQRLTRRTADYPDSPNTEVTTFSYDDQNQLITLTLESDDLDTDIITQFTYNEQNLRTGSDIDNNADGQTDQSLRLSYDVHGNISSIQTLDASGTLINTDEITYRSSDEPTFNYYAHLNFYSPD